MKYHLTIFGLQDTLWIDATIAASIFLISLLLAVLFNKLLFPVVLRFTQWTPSDLDSRIMRGIRLPLTLGIVVLGGYLALTFPLDLSEGQRDAADRVAGLLGIILGVFGVASIISNVFDWYIENVALRTRHTVAARLLPLFRRIAMVSVYGVGALLMLDQLNINISPLIAGLGLGGLAVALAIQPTLANLFAGTYVMTEGVISVGDYIELENGIAGYVMDVGWRSTRIRTWHNNMVVVPNSRFAETIITNYQRPSPAINVIVNCGVSYDSDLHRVEQVCREVMDEVLEADPNAVKKYGGWFGFDSFGDSNVDFWLFVQAKDRWSSFGLRTSLIQRLHQRFKEEGIVINYPVRTIQFPKEEGPEELLRQARIPSEVRHISVDVGEDAGEGGEGPGPG